jgi:hypothetical protein
MRNHPFVGAIVLLVLISPALGISALAQESARGTTLVCAGSGGDGWTLEEWTLSELTDYESRVGQPVALAHPETGKCQDPAGLAVDVGWVPGTKWLCGTDADGRWEGPSWVWEIYQSGNPVSPDPETGRCPQPWHYPQLIAIRTETGYAAATAVHMTELEVAGDYDRLYAWMHPDSQAIVPEAAMEGWYREVFSARIPTWMTVDNVRLVEWTWDVTGKVYPSAAEVTYRQRFADGAETEGVTHLVRDNGVWRWFFGGSREFVEDQVTRFGGRVDPSEDTAPPLASIPGAGTTTEGAMYDILDLGTGNGNWSSAYDINERSDVLWT